MAIFQSSIVFSLLLGCSLILPCQSRNDAECFDHCKCCLNETCHSQHGWVNVCSKGCIDGHRGARCYEYCKYSNCKSCGAGSLTTTCTACKDGYYLGPDKNCTLRCPANCKDGKCESFGGVCSEGCKDNFKGSFCDVCDGVYDDIVCSLSSENSQQSESSSKIFITLGSILGFVAVAIVTAGFTYLVWKKRSSQRNLREATLDFERPTSTLEINPVSENKKSTITAERESVYVTNTSIEVYKNIEEHDYQQMAASGSDFIEMAEAPGDDSKTDYYNVP